MIVTNLVTCGNAAEPSFLTIYYCHINTPVGPFLLAGTDEVLWYSSFDQGKGSRSPDVDWRRDWKPLQYAIQQLEAYFEGDLKKFTIPLQLTGSPFQLSVWETLKTIKFGTTATYGDIARKIGKPLASQAVGAANGANPIPIIIPCHRIIGADGSLTGFGGGLPTKHALLRHEGIASPKDQLELFEYHGR